MATVFISYKRNDIGFEEKLSNWIEAQGFKAWYDKGIRVGKPWSQVIDDYINEAICVVVILTPEALKSHYITYEWSYALGLGRPVFPLLFDGVKMDKVHPKLSQLQMAKFNHTNPDDWEWGKLLDSLLDAQGENDVQSHIKTAEYDAQHKSENWLAPMKLLYSDTDPQSTKSLERLSRLTVPEKSIDAGLLLAQKTNYQSEAPIDGLQKGLDPKYNKFDDCVEALGRIGGDKAGKYLLNALHQATNDRARQPILIKAIGRAKYRGAVQDLHSLLSRNDIHINVRHAILIALGDIGDKASFEILKNIVQDTSQERVIRILATQSLGKNEDPRVGDVLIPIIDRYRQYLSDDERQVAHKAIEAMIALNTDAGNTQLQKCLQWPDFAPWRQMIENHLTAQGISL